MLTIRLLGPAELRAPDGSVLEGLLRQPKRLALLAYLAAARPLGLHRRDTVIGLFWPESTEKQARQALSQALHVLRNHLGEAAMVTRGDGEIGVNEDLVSVDVAEFERAVSTGDLEAAMESYRGDLLPGFFVSGAPEFERWLEEERASLRESAVRTASLLADRYEEQGNTLGAIDWCKRATAIARDDERVLRRLLTVLDGHGDRAGALRAYERFKLQLEKEYDAEPAPETVALVEAIKTRETPTPKPTAKPAQGGTAPTLPAPAHTVGSTDLQQVLADRYLIERQIGEGAAATVYLAVDQRYDNRRVALKVVRPELVSAVGPERFLREIAIVAQLNHPHILPLFDSDETDHVLYYAMPYVAGGSLRERLVRQRQLPTDEVLRILKHVASALDHAHSNGVIHRDIKPANILLHEGEPMVADFSIALKLDPNATRFTDTGLGIGTPEYVSPEQAVGDPVVDERTDVYSLGCVVYEMLGGEPPHTGVTPQAVIARKVTDPPRSLRTLRAAVPPAVEELILKSLHSVPADRFASAGEFAAAVADAWKQPAAPVTLVDEVSQQRKLVSINQPPCITPSYFQDREAEVGIIEMFLADQSKRLLTVVGRGGVGKTAVVCRALEQLKVSDQAEQEQPNARAIIYLTVYGSQPVLFARLITDLSKLLSEKDAAESSGVLRSAGATPGAKLQVLLERIRSDRVVILIDNFEDAIDSKSSCVIDTEFDEAVRSLLESHHHGVKLILTTRVPPRELLLVQPGRQSVLHLDNGLESPYAENVLKEMDLDGVHGTREAPEELLDTARVRTLGNPRALEALFASLAADRDASLEQILGSGIEALPGGVVEAFVGDAFRRLEPSAQLVMQGLAAFGQPVPVAAVDELLVSFLPETNARNVLGRLVNMQLARKDARGYYLHSADQEYAWAQLAAGDPPSADAISSSTPSQSVLKQRAAQYYESVQRPTAEWKSIDDLAEPLAEFELRVAARDSDGAAKILARIGFHYLLLWGHYALALDMYERVADKVLDPVTRQWTIGDLGTAYWRVGRYRAAIHCYNDSLAIARSRNDRRGEAGILGNLGTCYSELGYIQRAIENHRQAVEIQQHEGDELGEATQVGNLGMTLKQVGEFDEAVSCGQRALALAREIGNRSLEAEWMGGLGEISSLLGDTSRAIELLDDGYRIATDIGARLVAVECLGVKGDVLLDCGDLERAGSQFEQAIVIADEIGNPRSRWLCRAGLALVRMCADDMTAALGLAEEVKGLDHPMTSYRVHPFVLLLARADKQKGTRKAFKRAIRSATQLLDREPRLYDALDAKGLALAGLAVLTGDRKHAASAREAYAEARAVTCAPGVVRRVELLLDQLGQLDDAGVLEDVRRVAVGG